MTLAGCVGFPDANPFKGLKVWNVAEQPATLGFHLQCADLDRWENVTLAPKSEVWFDVGTPGRCTLSAWSGDLTDSDTVWNEDAVHEWSVVLHPGADGQPARLEASQVIA